MPRNSLLEGLELKNNKKQNAISSSNPFLPFCGNRSGSEQPLPLLRVGFWWGGGGLWMGWDAGFPWPYCHPVDSACCLPPRPPTIKKKNLKSKFSSVLPPNSLLPQGWGSFWAVCDVMEGAGWQSLHIHNCFHPHHKQLIFKQYNLM